MPPGMKQTLTLPFMQIEIEDRWLQKAGLSPETVRLTLAIALFQDERLTLAQASELAGLHFIQFQKELASRDIPIHYGEEEFQRDLENLKHL